MNDRALEDPVENDELLQDYKKLSDNFLTHKLLVVSFIDPKNEIPDNRKNCLLEISSEDEEDKYWQSGYYEDGKWFKWNGCASQILGSEYVSGWRYTAV